MLDQTQRYIYIYVYITFFYELLHPKNKITPIIIKTPVCWRMEALVTFSKIHISVVELLLHSAV